MPWRQIVYKMTVNNK